MQPTYIPWLGYFDLICRSECFVFLNDVQFEKKSWQQRNRIKTSNGELLLSVPVLTKGKLSQKIYETQIDNNQQWAKSHLKSIEFSYKKTPYFNLYFDLIKEIYSKNYDKLEDLTIGIITLLAHELGLRVPFLKASEMELLNHKEGRILGICKNTNSSILYDAKGAEGVIDSNYLLKEGVNVIFQEYHHPRYSQLHGDFLPNMSIIDLLFNEGKKSLEIIQSGSKPLK